VSRIFLSHSGADARQALALKKWLVEQDPPLANEIFLAIDPSGGLLPGDRWKVELKRAAGRCEAVVCLLSQSWANSHECKVEFRLAEQLNKQVLCARLEPSPADELSSEYQRCDLFREGRTTAIDLDDGTSVEFATEGLFRLRDAVRGTGIGARSFVWPPPNEPERAPYRGWDPFEPQDAAVFFGRDAAVVRAVDQLRGIRQSGVESLFVVLGPSGTGKSSFLRAGILPRLAREERRFVTLDVVRPGRNPITGDTGLAMSITNARRRFGMFEPQLGDVKVACADDHGAALALLTELQRAAADRLPDDGGTESPAPPTLVVPLDQAEELFTTDAGGQAAQFFSLIKSLTDAGLGLVVVATIRTDRYDVMQTDPAVAKLTTRVFEDLRPMPPNQFKEVITGPAERSSQAGHPLVLEPELVDRLMADAAEGGDALPLLSLTLAGLYEDYGSSGALTVDHYKSTGGIGRVVQNAIDSVLDDNPATRTRQLEALREAFIPWLATINSSNDQPMRRVARWAELPESSRPIIDALVEKRLMIKDIRDGDVVVEVALESLLRQWDDLTQWLRENRIDLLAADDLERAAAAWQAHDRSSAWLLTGTRLIDAEALASRPGFQKSLASVAPFLAAARDEENERTRLELVRREADLVAAQAKREAAEAHTATLRTRSRITAGIAVLAVVVAGAAGVAFVQARTARVTAQERLLESTSLRLASDATSGTDPFMTFQEDLAANAIRPTLPARSALYSAVIRNLHTARILGGHAGGVEGGAFSPDGNTLATASTDGTTRLWEVATGKSIGHPLKGHTDAVFAVAFSPDGKTLATASLDKTAQLWDVATGSAIGRPLSHPDEVVGVAFSPDGTKLATASLDHYARLWDAATGNPIGHPLSHPDMVYDIAFSPDGTKLATAGRDRTARLWDASTGSPIGRPLSHPDEVFDLAFSPDGTKLATASLDHYARLWDVATGNPIGHPLSHTDKVSGVAFSPDGTKLATASRDRTARLWDVTTGTQIGDPLTGHTDEVNDLAFSPDGKTLATVSADKTARLWDVTTGIRIDHPLTGHTAEVFGVAFSPDGKTLATASADQTARLWDATTGTPIGDPLRGHTQPVVGVAFSPDGKTLATASKDQTARLWDATTGKPIGDPLRGHTDAVLGVAFSPDGKTLATASKDKTARLWDVATGNPIGHPLSHPDEVSSVAFSPDGSKLATASRDKTARLWDATTGTPIGDPLRGHTQPVVDVAFSPDGKTLATASADQTARLWDATTGTPIGDPLRGHTDAVLGVAFSPDGTTLATASWDQTARLWNVSTGTPFGDPLRAHTDAVYGVAFSPDGKTLATAGLDHTARLWPATARPEDLCAKLNANMSEKHWNQWVSPNLDYIKVCTGLPIAPDE
jgi:WD40 repeat protein